MTDRRGLRDIQAVFLDMDGVLYVENRPIPGAAEVLEYFRSKAIPYRFITNRTTQSLETIHLKLQNMGLPAARDAILSAPLAAILYLREIGSPPCYFLLSEDAQRDFAEFPISRQSPKAVIIGDIGDRWSYGVLNEVFRMVLNGAEMIALHKGRYWQVEDGLHLDIGVFVAGLEYATGKKARVVGKPSASFFRLALDHVGLSASQVAMVGDDIDADVGAAQRAGLKGILVKTGKYRASLVAESKVRPDAVLESLQDIRRYL